MEKKYSLSKQEMDEDFHRFIKKPLENILGGEVSFTSMTDKIGQLFAQVSGIDAVLIRPEEELTGIGISILYGKNHRTFAIRSLSETGIEADFEKFHLTRNMGGFTLQYHVQVYLDEDRTQLLGMAVAKMKDIYNCLIEKERLRETEDSSQARIPSKYHILKWDTVSSRHCWYREVSTEESQRGENENTD